LNKLLKRYKIVFAFEILGLQKQKNDVVRLDYERFFDHGLSENEEYSTVFVIQCFSVSSNLVFPSGGTKRSFCLR
jgi:hypothetical protein